jgi:hypothetical protein
MSQKRFPKRPLTQLRCGLGAAAIAVAALLAVGCDSGGSSGMGSSSTAGSSEAKIEGNVQDIHGPINEGKIEVRDKSGQLITTLQLDGSSNHYSVTVPPGTSYPIVLTATPKEGSNSQVVRAVVTSSLADRMDITDITSLVVDSAIALGGLTEENIAKASGSAIGLRQRQGVSAGAGGGGMGPGQSGGGAGRGGHAGHDMSNMGGGSGSPPPAGGQPQSGQMPNMQH